MDGTDYSMYLKIMRKPPLDDDNRESALEVQIGSVERIKMMYLRCEYTTLTGEKLGEAFSCPILLW
jgi:hypothetical protein